MMDRCRCNRRVFLAGVAGLSMGLAGCLGDEADNEPIDLTGDVTCDVCGMVIEEHFGPAAQAFYDEGPPNRDGPARFDSVAEMVTYDQETHWGREAAFATDYSQVESEPERVDGTPYMPTDASQNVFEPVESLAFVVGSELEGAMGPDAFPFGTETDAEAVTADFGGEVVEWADLPAALG